VAPKGAGSSPVIHQSSTVAKRPFFLKRKVERLSAEHWSENAHISSNSLDSRPPKFPLLSLQKGVTRSLRKSSLTLSEEGYVFSEFFSRIDFIKA
jgi:hypothetical protein